MTLVANSRLLSKSLYFKLMHDCSHTNSLISMVSDNRKQGYIKVSKCAGLQYTIKYIPFLTASKLLGEPKKLEGNTLFTCLQIKSQTY